MSRSQGETSAFDTHADPRDFYTSFPPAQSNGSPRLDRHASLASEYAAATPASISEYTHAPATSRTRSVSRSPTQTANVTFSTPPAVSLTSSKSTPNLPPSARNQQRSFKDLVNRFNQYPQAPGGAAAASPTNARERYRRTPEHKPTKLVKPRSPVKAGRGQYHVKMQSRRDLAAGRSSPGKMVIASDPNKTASMAARNRVSPSSTSPTRQKLKMPLFGEVMLDRTGDFNAGYGIPVYRFRRGSEGSLTQPASRSLHLRSQSNAEPSPGASPDLQNGHTIFGHKGHQRSQSDLSSESYQHEKRFKGHEVGLHPSTESHFSRRYEPDCPSHIPISTRHHHTGEPLSISPYTTPTSHRPKNLFPSPTASGEKARLAFGKENQLYQHQTPSSQTLSSRTYDPSANSTSQSGPTLRAYISAPAVPHSPTLRSSRPRQPVSTATTTSSRARALERIANQDGAKEDLSAARSRQKKFPNLGKVDFAERRAKIERAISQNIKDEDRSDAGSASARSSRSNSVLRRQSQVDSLDPVDAFFGPTGQDYAVQEVAEGLHSLESEMHHGLRLDVHQVPGDVLTEPLTAGTEFETDDLPLAGTQAHRAEARQPGLEQQSSEALEVPSLDNAALETPRASEFSNVAPADGEEIPQSLLSHIIRMRERSNSSASRTDFAENSSVSYSPSDQASIRIMLGGELPDEESHRVWGIVPSPLLNENPTQEDAPSATVKHAHLTDQPLYRDKDLQDGNAVYSAPHTPRKGPPQDSPFSDSELTPRQDTKPPPPSITATLTATSGTDKRASPTVQQIMEHVQSSGSIPPETARDLEERITALSTSHDGVSDAATIQILLDNKLLDYQSSLRQTEDENRHEEQVYLSPARYSGLGTSLVRSMDDSFESDASAGCEASMASSVGNNRASFVEDSETELNDGVEQPGLPLQHSGQLPQLTYEPPQTPVGEEGEAKNSTPPPKDTGLSPRLSPMSHDFDDRPPSPPSARLSKASDYQLYLPEFDPGSGLGQGLGLSIDSELTAKDPVAHPPPPPPVYSPPPPPSQFPTQNQFVIDVPAGSFHGSSPTSPRSPRAQSEQFYNKSRSIPPSTASSKFDRSSMPTTQSMSSLSQESVPPPSIDPSSPANADEPNISHKRLAKRRNIIKELIDTEYSYHQDMKIIEDIYKATVGELITLDDKKVLFGNADQVEAFSLEFYDALRRAVAPFYVPQRSSRWHTKRGSFSTSTSGNTDQTTGESADEEKDRKTVVGQVFELFLPRMEKVYAAYLKNHDSANQRLSKLQGDTTVKCWLAECHNNASDITSAWDLDSLLVKPVQRILKYPLLLQQLLESTTADHPDRLSLERAVRESMNISQRINEAKKRADLVEQIVNRKRKDSDVRTGIAKAFGRRTEKLKERVGIAEAYQDSDFDELAHKFGGHFIRLQVCMRDVQGSLAETDKAVERFGAFAAALEAYIEVGQNSYPEIESKWRKYALAIRELTAVALTDHKAAINRRVIEPMVLAIKLHEGPQNAITKRKKRIVDYAKCKSIEKRGEKPDKKTLEASELYEALNEQLKIDLPKLYSLTADLIQACLACQREIQMDWLWTWEMKLRPVLDEFPQSLDSITPAFWADHEIVHAQLMTLGLCNGSLLAEAANFLSPQTTLVGDDASSQRRRGVQHTSSSRTLSVGSEYSPSMTTPDLLRARSGSFTNSPMNVEVPPLPNGQVIPNGRLRSSSSLSNRGRALSSQSVNGPPSRVPSNSRMPSMTSKNSFSGNRPSTASSRPADLAYTPSYTRVSADTHNRSPRPGSGASYFTAHQEPTNQRYSGMFSSAMPMSELSGGSGPTSPRNAPEDMPVMFVAASLFEFNIDRARREAGYPYLTYVQGEVFDVVAQKGELWLAKNQDDGTNSLGWIWEQHFVILSQDS